jgi:N-glycosylase/DNA lyase
VSRMRKGRLHMGTFSYLEADKIRSIDLPDALSPAVEGVVWGLPEHLFSPAYWYTQYLLRGGTIPSRNHRLGETFEEEVVACVLGGFGIPAEVGLAAFERVKYANLIRPSVLQDEIEEALREPMLVRGRSVRYRFWSQKAKYLADILSRLGSIGVVGASPRALRSSLMEMRGIGPKTGSWIVRNWCNANDVAILDIHVIRAGRLMRLFDSKDNVECHYLSMEARFLDLAEAINVPAGDLDALMWSLMRETPTLVSRLLDSANEPASFQRGRQEVQGRLRLA